MAEILEYRAKSFNTGQWVSGNLIQNPDCEKSMIGLVVNYVDKSFSQYEKIDIDEKTIGLVSNVSFKIKGTNEKRRVADGDIIECMNRTKNKKWVVSFKKFGFVVDGIDGPGMTNLRTLNSLNKIEIIGTKYDEG